MIARSSTALVAAGLLALAGCAKGPIRGQLALPDQTPQAASLNYASGLFGKTGKLSTTLPTGESFTGPYRLDPAAPDKTITSTLAGNRGKQHGVPAHPHRAWRRPRWRRDREV